MCLTNARPALGTCTLVIVVHFHSRVKSESRQLGNDCDCQAQPLISARRSYLQMRSGLFVVPEQCDWLLLFYSFYLCWLMPDYAWLRGCVLLSLALIQHMSPGWLTDYVRYLWWSVLFFFSPLRWLCLHTVRDLLINPLILEGHWLLITMASYKNWSLHITAEHESFPLLLQNTHTHTCCYGNTHSHLDSFSCSAAWQKPSRWEWNNTLIRQEGHGAMWPTHTNTQIPLVQTPEKRTSD